MGYDADGDWIYDNWDGDRWTLLPSFYLILLNRSAIHFITTSCNQPCTSENWPRLRTIQHNTKSEAHLSQKTQLPNSPPTGALRIEAPRDNHPKYFTYKNVKSNFHIESYSPTKKKEVFAVIIMKAAKFDI